MSLQTKIEELFVHKVDAYGDEYFRAFDEFKAALNCGGVLAVCIGV